MFAFGNRVETREDRLTDKLIETNLKYKIKKEMFDKLKENMKGKYTIQKFDKQEPMVKIYTGNVEALRISNLNSRMNEAITDLDYRFDMLSQNAILVVYKENKKEMPKVVEKSTNESTQKENSKDNKFSWLCCFSKSKVEEKAQVREMSI